jgi:hypothetical protein
MAHAVERLTSKCATLSSNPNTAKKKRNDVLYERILSSEICTAGIQTIGGFDLMRKTSKVLEESHGHFSSWSICV